MPRIKVHASKDEARVKIKFDYEYDLVQKVKSIGGARYVGPQKGGPHWIVPMRIETVRRLRSLFGDQIRFADELLDWGKDEIELEETLIKLAMADDAELEVVPDMLPECYETLHPFQRAGIKFAVTCPHPLIADQPGLGKTREAICAIFEAELDYGKHLVIAPKTSLNTTWFEELVELQPYAVWVASGSASQKQAAIDEFMAYDEPAWLITNPATVQFVRVKGQKDTFFSRFPDLFEIAWDTITLDECQKAGLRDIKTLTARGLLGLSLAPGGKRMALSGTPMGGKAVNLWPILHFLDPKEFSSKWAWIESWLVNNDGDWGKEVGNVREELQDEFDRYITRFMLRRTKAEVYPQLPGKQYVPVWVEMTPKQSKQYKEFALAAEVKIEDDHLSATSILAEYMRLKQFAISYSKIDWIDRAEEKYKVIPDGFDDSPKLEALEQLLDERGIFDEEQDTDEQVVIFSQFSVVVDWICKWLREKKGVEPLKITGAVSEANRNAATRDFQNKQAKVIVMTTTAGGVSITLDAADTVIFMDETWVPDDQEQGEDRIHRVSRIHQVTCYYIRTLDTIEHYIEQRVARKQDVNNVILDLRREGLRATG